MAESRRSFLTKVGMAGGYPAVQLVMQGLGWAATPVAAAPLALPADAGRGRTVAILGAGIAGLSAAHELTRAGFACTVLEAQGRVGGRVWTLRGGDLLPQAGEEAQRVAFDAPHYFNAGAGRLPHEHRRMLGYCRELGVPLEVLVNESRSALAHAENENGGRPVQLRQVVYDTRGRVAELMAKSLAAGALERAITRADAERLISFLAQWGRLAPDLFYRGSPGAGFEVAPDAGAQPGRLKAPLDLGALIDPNFWRAGAFADAFDMQPTMFQPVGGMDAIPRAFAARLGDRVQLQSAVTAMRREGAGVRIEYTQAGRPQALRADYCLCTIPFGVLAKIPADFAADRAAAIARTRYANALKIAFQAPRFWETEQAIYGGLSFTSRDSSVVWYPSAGFQSAEGVVIAAYAFDPRASRLGAQPQAAQIAHARETMEILHPGHGQALKHGLALQWSRVPFIEGAWASPGTEDPAGYALLSEPDGPFYFAGEHLSHIGAWQEGAVASAHYAIGRMAAEAGATRRA